jgi:ubiquinone/menaquinone biosynthesis C-methylase UbiE
VGFFDQNVFPRINDFALGPEVDSLRAAVAGGARGRILEIGAGTGLNARHYPEGAEVIAIEPSEGMRRRARERLKSQNQNQNQNQKIQASIDLRDGRVEALPFDAASFDAVVLTFVLCSVKDLGAALGEIRRVLKPGGELRLVEHVKSPDPGIARWQRRVRPVWMTLLGGCDPCRDIEGDLARAEFNTKGLESVKLPLPKLARAGILGSAIRL